MSATGLPGAVGDRGSDCDAGHHDAVAGDDDQLFLAVGVSHQQLRRLCRAGRGSRRRPASRLQPSVDSPSTSRITSPARIPELLRRGVAEWPHDHDRAVNLVDGRADAFERAADVLAGEAVALGINEDGVRIVQGVENAVDRRLSRVSSEANFAGSTKSLSSTSTISSRRANRDCRPLAVDGGRLLVVVISGGLDSGRNGRRGRCRRASCAGIGCSRRWRQ